MMIKTFLLLLLTCLAIGCRQANRTSKNGASSSHPAEKDSSGKQLSFDTTTITILPNNQIRFFSLKDSLPAILTNADIQRIDSLLLAGIGIHNKAADSNKVYSDYIRPEKYKRQYVAYTGADGQKKVFVNCFCIGIDRFDDWKDKLVEIEDGGYCFFNITIDLGTGTFGPLLINGPG